MSEMKKIDADGKIVDMTAADIAAMPQEVLPPPDVPVAPVEVQPKPAKPAS